MTETYLRIAFRVEGDNWVAYYAPMYTMVGAVVIASVKMVFVMDKARKDEFMAFVRNVFSDLTEASIGVRPEWNEPESAPEHERSGQA